MKKLFLYSTLILALSACKNESSVKKDEKTSSSTSTSGSESGTTTSGSTTTTPVTTSGSWSSADKNMFVTTCTDAAVKGGMSETKAKDYCSCMLEKIEMKYPDSQDAGKMTTNETTEMAKECLR